MSEGQVATLLLWLVLLAFSLNASLLRTLHANPLYQHLCLGSALGHQGASDIACKPPIERSTQPRLLRGG